ncbi:hypothetical protein [Cytophaga sp.]
MKSGKTIAVIKKLLKDTGSQTPMNTMIGEWKISGAGSNHSTD